MKNIPEDIKKKHKEILWRHIAGTRDILIHAYFGVNMDMVWDVVKKDLPLLKSQIAALKKSIRE